MGVILKDWYGKDQTYEHNTFFVRDENGEIVQFSRGTGKPTLQDKNITENGTYTADSGFDGLGSVMVDVKGSGGDVEGVPFLKMISVVEQNKNKTNVATTQSLKIPKGAKIIRAWKESAFAPKQSYYPGIQSVVNVSLDELVIDESNADYELVSYTHAPYLSIDYESCNTFEFRLLVLTDIITVNGGENGLFDGTLNKCDGDTFFSQTDRGVEQTMYLKTFHCADGVTRLPKHVCYKQSCLESIDLSNVVEIGEYAFGYCESLGGELVIPNTITVIPREAFRKTKFDRVVFPHGLTKIDYYAFGECTHQTEFDFSACTAVPTLTANYHLGKVGNGQVLKIPSALFDSWSTTTGWKDWASQMVAV